MSTTYGNTGGTYGDGLYGADGGDEVVGSPISLDGGIAVVVGKQDGGVVTRTKQEGAVVTVRTFHGGVAVRPGK